MYQTKYEILNGVSKNTAGDFLKHFEKAVVRKRVADFESVCALTKISEVPVFM